MSETLPPEPVAPAAPVARLVDRIREKNSDGRKSIIVPEWDGVELFFSRMTIGDMRSVKDRSPKDDYDRNLMLLIHKARYADGSPAFTMGDKHYLETEADLPVVQRVIGFMFTVAMPPGSTDAGMVAEKKKEIEGTPTASSVTA